ncbi:nucleotide sugar dehydrogenase [Candidatus Bathyarchaeota archaeon]|nr:nucleotide sugar dehydrogenase [Candidatus Bathyarchaeota archaeon]
MEKIAVFGLGYVGLPLAELSKSKGFSVVGVDISKEALKKAKEVGVKTSSDDVKTVKNADIILVCVPTPIDAGNMPNLSAVKNACKSISKGLKKSQLIIIESTIYPGVTEEVVQPILEKSGLKAGVDFYLAHCPERIDPGNSKWNVGNLPRVVGGIGEKSVKKAADFYSKLVDAEVLELSTVRAAEATKIMENAFRDVNIAFMNEMAKSFDNMGIDITEVIKAAATKPFAFMPHYPGCGVGGHCIPVDPYYLIEEAKKKGFNHRFLSLAREINNSMPEYTVRKVIEGLNEAGLSVKGAKVTVLGYAYKRDVEDIRESPAIKVVDGLQKLGAKVEIYDPYIKDKSTVKSLEDALKSDCIVLVTDHTEFRGMDYGKLKAKVVVDGRNCLDKDKIKSKGIVYRGVGRNT